MSRQRLTKFLIISVCWMVINVHGFTVAAEPVARVVGVEGVVSVIRKDNALPNATKPATLIRFPVIMNFRTERDDPRFK